MVCRASMSFCRPGMPKKKQVFSGHAKIVVPIEYVLTVYEACHLIEDPCIRYDVYMNHGVDGRMVEKYLDKVLELNRTMKKK